ncbi:D(1) dopamine receptor-like [Apteryx rowi]|uniref:D(1) dopamine receptor-like n=1 Tax=Apteryx rowi TaxID=308060 RepID=UPI000E1E041A|nr:D(1) dopamine receptor-like [Apteryx rowi]XP_025937506.1 D(1) dopamine receptor-like [Apteryx rowi]XP_025937507.1 D(1) dopamine receptor-like [Apteryx rowi]XP_025937508.1 D(1) dopamine receptor-like [Apteryx rowi]XP_025937509.1 D(1) dopamine receptor-like [Apteryx rowi]XP_025937510.1 D(1) dopamine receptor-like [Apteryx rowi]
MDGFYASGEGDKQDAINDTSSRKSWTEEGSSELSFRVVTAALLFLLILSTLLGNTLVCVTVVKFRHLRSKVTNFFVISLAVSDLLVAVLVMPWKAVTEVMGFWPFGAFCDVWVAFDIMCSTASILNLCIISVDRYWAISNPFRYERKMTQRVAFIMIGVAWLLSLLISFIPVQLKWHKDRELLSQQEPGFNVTWEEENCDSSLSRAYAISSSLVSFYIPVAIMIVTYTRIFRIAQQQIRRISSLERAVEHAQNCHSSDCPHEASLKNSFKKETKVLKTLSIIMGVFVFCWLPFFVLNCIVPFCDLDLHEPGELPCVSETVFNIFVWFGWANSSLNPIIYAFNADFRRAFATILGCGCPCPSNAVETVNFSNELVSYHHDTTYQKEVVTVSYSQLLPHAALQMENNEVSFDKVSQISEPACNTCPMDVLPAVVHVEQEMAVSLEKITPFTANALD